MMQNEMDDVMRPAARAALDRGLTCVQAQTSFLLALMNEAVDRSDGKQADAAKLLHVTPGHVSRVVRGMVHRKSHKKPASTKKTSFARAQITATQAIGAIEL